MPPAELDLESAIAAAENLGGAAPAGAAWAVYAVAGLALLVGLILWLAGGRILKPIVVMAFSALGAAAGYILLPLAPLTNEFTAPIGAAIGLAAGALLGVVLYRFAMAAGLGIALGVMAPAAAALLLNIQPPQPATTDNPAPALSTEEMFLRGIPREDRPEGGLALLEHDADSFEEQVRERLSRLIEQVEQAGGDIPADARADPTTPETNAPSSPPPAGPTVEARVRAFSAALFDEAAAAWSALTDRHRTILTTATIGGVVLGLAFGLLAPRWAAAGVTAMVGAAVWVPAGAWLATGVGSAAVTVPHLTPGEWVGVWLAAAMIGAAVQWAGLVKWKLKRSTTETA